MCNSHSIKFHSDCPEAQLRQVDTVFDFHIEPSHHCLLSFRNITADAISSYCDFIGNINTQY